MTAPATRRRRPVNRLLALALVSAAVLAGCADDDGDLEAFCAVAADEATLAATFDLDPFDLDPEAALTQFRAALEVERDVRADAPDAVRDDVDVLVEFLDDVVTGLEQHLAGPAPVPDDSGRVPPPPVFEELEPRFDEVARAGGRLERFVSSNCPPAG